MIFLQGEIYDGNANELVMKLLYLQSENRRKDIHFYINSPGGSVTSTMAIYDTMQVITCPVATYCVGLAASGGSRAAGRRHQGQALRPEALEGDDPPAARRRRRPGLGHRDSSQRDRQDARRRSTRSSPSTPGRAFEARSSRRATATTTSTPKRRRTFGLVDDIMTSPPGRPRKTTRTDEKGKGERGMPTGISSPFRFPLSPLTSQAGLSKA